MDAYLRSAFYGEVRCNIVNVGFINNAFGQDGSDIEIHGPLRSNRKLKVEGSSLLGITRMILGLNGIVTMHAVPGTNDDYSVIWYVTNVSDFYISGKSQASPGVGGIEIRRLFGFEGRKLIITAYELYTNCMFRRRA